MASPSHTLFVLLYFIVNAIGNPSTLDSGVDVTIFFKFVYAMGVNGVPSYGIESADPLKRNLVVISAPYLNYTFTDGEVTGMKNCSVISAKYYNNVTKFELKLNCPQVNLTSKYDINGKVLSYDVFGQGEAHILSENVDITIYSDIERIKKNNKTYVLLNNSETHMDVKDRVVYHFENLFNGNEELSKTVHTAANKNWREVAKQTGWAGVHSYMIGLIENLNIFINQILDHLQI